MAEGYLPPVVIALELDDEGALAQLAAFRDAVAKTADEAGASTSRMAGSASGDMKDLADDSKGYLAGDVAGNMGAVGDKADETASRVHDSAGRISSDLENIGAGAVAGSSVTKDAMEDASKGVGDAERDIESKSGGFSSRVAGIFKSVGSSMGNWGIPFGSSVSKMGEKIDEAESHGSGLKASLEAVGKTATIVGGVALAGFAAESVHMADEFDVAQVQLQTAIKNTGGSFDAVKPQIEGTYSRLARLGFENTEVARSMSSLVIATRSPTTAMGDMSVAADLARAKNMSLEAATQTLTKVYAGSTRALTQLGINLDIGTGKLKSIQSATESVKAAQLAYKGAQEEAATATGEKAVAADAKLEQAHLKLQQAQTKLSMDQRAIPAILQAVQQRTEGAAKAYGQTLAGQLKVAGAQLHNLAVSFGEVLIPVITKAASVLAGFIGGLTKGSPVAIALAAVIAGPLVASMAVYMASLIRAAAANVATVAGWIWAGTTAVASAAVQVASWVAVGAAATAAFVAENVATLGMVAAIGAVIAAVVFLATHWTQAWDTIKQIVASAVEWVKSHLTLVMVALAALLGPIGVLIDGFILLATKWREITSTIATLASNLVGAVTGFFAHLPGDIIRVVEGIPGDFAALWRLVESGVSKLIGGIVHFFSTLPSKVVSAVESLPGDMLKLGEEIMQAIINGVEHLASAFVSMLKKTILGPVESIIGAVESLFGGGGGKGGGKTVAGSNYSAVGGSAVETEILETARKHGLSAAAAAAMVGNASQESSLNPGEPGGGLYQMSGYPGSDSAGSAAQQTVKAIELMGANVVAAMNRAKSPAEAANIMMKEWEKPKGSQPGEEASIGIANPAHREQAAEEAARHIKGAIETAQPTTAATGLSKAISGTSAKEAQKAIEHTKAEGVKKAIETAKLDLTEAKKVFSSAFGELAKTAQTLFKMTLAKGGVKTRELETLEAGHEVAGNANAVEEAEANLRKAEGTAGTTKAQQALEAARRKQQEAEAAQAADESKLATYQEERRKGKGNKAGLESAEQTVVSAKGSVASAAEATAKAEEEVTNAIASRGAEIKSAQEALNNALYTQKVAALKKESQAEETKIAKENSARTAAFTTALNQLKTHLEKGKVTTHKAMADIEKVLRKYGITFGSVGKDAGKKWVEEFERELKKAASDSGAIGALISADIKAGLKIPGLAAGGVVTSPTLAVIGEAGPEAVIPLNGLSTAQPGALPATAAGAAGKQIVINSQVYTNATTSQQTVNEQYQALRPLLLQAAG